MVEHLMSGMQRGMTLLELLVLIVILGLLTTQGMPAMGKLLREQRLQAASHALYQALYYTRSEAIRQGVPVMLVSEENGWEQGWRVFADRDDEIVRRARRRFRRSDPVIHAAISPLRAPVAIRSRPVVQAHDFPKRA